MNNDNMPLSFRSKVCKALKKKLFWGIPTLFFVLIGLIVVGFATTHAAIKYTSRNEFCFSCHIGMDTIVEEYKESSHFINKKPDGEPAATCSDCHVPNRYPEKLQAKVIALKDIYYKWKGTINLENFETERLRLAEYVWNHMEKTNSQNCRDCHKGDLFDMTKQPQRAALNHMQLDKTGKTCIDCHSGIAHKRPVLK